MWRGGGFIVEGGGLADWGGSGEVFEWAGDE